MTRITLFLMLTAGAAGAANCVNQPVRVFVFPTATMPDGATTVPSAIKGDGNWYNAEIKSCGGTYDMVLNLITGQRKLVYTIPLPIPGSVVQESIAAGSYQLNGYINIRNLTCFTCASPHSPFTTRAGGQFTLNRTTYQLRFMPDIVTAPDLHTPGNAPDENTPFKSSAVQVLPQPYDCLTGGPTKPAWKVRATLSNNDTVTPAGYSLQVGTAHRMNQSTAVAHAGQYSMPFELLVEATQCFAF